MAPRFCFLMLAMTRLGLSAPQLVAQERTAIKHVIATVAGTNDEWTPTGLVVEPGDIVITIAHGTVRVGQSLGDVDATGTRNGSRTSTGVGILQYKIGTSAGFPTGVQGLFVATVRGPFKLRVYDSQYADNAGAFQVNIIVIPASAVPPATPASE